MDQFSDLILTLLKSPLGLPSSRGVPASDEFLLTHATKLAYKGRALLAYLKDHQRKIV
jgi:hypothetical protein